MKRVVALAALQLGDIGTTLVGLGRGATETGVVAAPALRLLGVAGLILIPLLGVGVQLIVLRSMPRRFRSAGWTLVLALATVPIVSNALVLVR